MKFLSLSEVLAIHRDQITRYGGASGIRDIELLKSALGMPPATYGGEFLHSAIFEMAAAYLLVMMSPKRKAFHGYHGYEYPSRPLRLGGSISSLVFVKGDHYIT